MRDYDRQEELRKEDEYADFMERNNYHFNEDDREDERNEINKNKRC